MKNTYYSNGKLLLTGEYVVLDGASALVVPTRFGQSLEVNPADIEGVYWESLDKNSAVWFKAIFLYGEKGSIILNDTDPVSKTLHQILVTAKQLNPDFLTDDQGWNVTTYLNFSRNWGLGTSSTLINNVAQWADVDPYSLLSASFGGSGFDIAAAQHDSPIQYRLRANKPIVEEIELQWPFKDQLFFVHLNKKQDSRTGVLQYRKATVNSEIFDAIDEINQKLIVCQTISEFETLLERHEQLISGILNTPVIKSRLFPDYPKCIKSLGAWGGDFALATGGNDEKDYFRSKGYLTLIDYSEMVK